MKLRKPDLRTSIYIFGTIVFVLMVLIKQASIRQSRQAEIVSVLNEWQSRGKPVRVEEVVRRNVPVYVKLTLQPRTQEQWQGYVSPQIRKQLRPGREVICETPRGEVNGRITGVADELSRESGLFAVEVVFDRPVTPVEPGLAAYARVRTFTDAVAVPEEALEREQGENLFVWVVRNDRAYRVPVRLSYRGPAGAVIEEGVVPGDIVVAAGRTQLQPGDRVRVIPTR